MPTGLRVLRSAVLTAALAAAALLGAGVLFLLHPQLFLNPRSGAFLLTRLGGAYGPRWQGLEVSAEHVGGARHRYGLGLTEFCFADAGGAVDGCFKKLEVVLTVAYSGRGVGLERVERFVALGRRLRLEPAKRPAATAPPRLPVWPRYGFGLVRVSLPSVVVVGATGLLTGRLSVDSDDSGTATGWAEVLAEAGPLRSMKLNRCSLTGAAPAELTCGFSVSPRLPADARLVPFKTLTGEVRLKGGVSKGGYALGLDASLDPVKDWYSVRGEVSVEAKGALGGPPELLEVKGTLDGGAPRFEDIVARLRDSPYAVPAPFHVMKGPLTLKASARGDPRGDTLLGNIRLSADLSSGRQRLACDATAQVTVKEPLSPRRAVGLEGGVLIKEGAFELPKIELAGVPKGTLDPRIRLGGEGEGLRDAVAPGPGGKGPAGVRGRVTLKTAKPLLLFSNLVKDPVPVSLDLLGEYPPPVGSGSVAVGRFGVELFRRSAVVEHVNVRLPPGGSVGALEGLVVYKTSDFVINIRLLGTTKKPFVEFSSVPALSREEILAMLIFGKRPGDLDPEALVSVGNTQRAIENRSFGLVSLYLFGAVPIQHVAYDGATKTATVKLRLPGGALIQLGSDFDRSRGLTLRQPLAPHWAIQSEFSEQGPETRFGTTFLEWFNRY